MDTATIGKYDTKGCNVVSAGLEGYGKCVRGCREKVLRRGMVMATIHGHGRQRDGTLLPERQKEGWAAAGEMDSARTEISRRKYFSATGESLDDNSRACYQYRQWRFPAWCFLLCHVLRMPLSRKQNFRITLRVPRALRYPADATVEVALITDPPGEKVHHVAARSSVLCTRGETL